MTLFSKKYRVEPARLPKWDYSSPGRYFVTVCTFDRSEMFGAIVNDEMRVNECGGIVNDEWEKSFEIRHELKCDEFIVMPNHIHGIIRIYGSGDSVVETHGRASLPINKTKPQTGIAYRTPKSISSFIAGFKSAATKRINELRKLPGACVWQPRFHDHIVRNERELFAIRQYIRNNPANWKNDRNVIETRETGTGKQPWFVYLPR
jgi:REP element-mobilizing transposase RayT